MFEVSAINGLDAAERTFGLGGGRVLRGQQRNAPLEPPVPLGAGIFDVVAYTFDLSASRRDVWGAVRALSPEDRDGYLQATANLLKQGVVGDETLEVNGRPYKTAPDARFADTRLRGARPYRGDTRRPTLDIRA